MDQLLHPQNDNTITKQETPEPIDYTVDTSLSQAKQTRLLANKLVLEGQIAETLVRTYTSQLTKALEAEKTTGILEDQDGNYWAMGNEGTVGSIEVSKLEGLQIQ